MRKKVYTLMVCAMFLCVANGQLKIKRVSTAPAIDGDESDWGTTWIQMDKMIGTTSDMTAKFQCEYDDNNLYFIFHITDATPGDTAIMINSWERDCVEVMLSMDTTSSTGITGMYELRRVYGWNAATGTPGGDSGLTDGTVFGDGVTIENWNANPNFQIKEVIADDTYIQEWQLPWDSLKVRMNPVLNKYQFKLEVQASDNTINAPGGRTQQLFWYGNSNEAWHNSAYQGVVTLELIDCKEKGTNCGPNDTTGIETSVLKNDLEIYKTTDNLLFSRKVTELFVYNIAGQLLITAKNTISVNISILKQGLYIAKAEGVSYKFVK